MWLWLWACSQSKIISDLDGDGFTVEAGDCDDSNVSAAPDQAEICDGIDNDCNGVIDDAIGPNVPLWYPDLDGDGFGVMEGAKLYCPAVVPSGYAQEGDVDCDDENPDIYPTAPEVCDGIDNNCDLRIDVDAVDATAWYPDLDLDSFGDASAAAVVDCEQPEGRVDNGADCDDANAEVSPLAQEVCDEIDNDCNDLIDEDIGPATTYYLDIDGDGFGANEIEVTTCEDIGPSVVLRGGDCDEFDPTIYPGSTMGVEDPNGSFAMDYNCDLQVACLDMGCDSAPELWTAPAVGDSQLLQWDGTALTLTGLSNIRLAEKLPLQSDRYARIVTLQGDPCLSAWLSLTVGVTTPEVSALGISSTQAQKVLLPDINGDQISDLVVIGGYGADDGMNCIAAPSVQYFRMQLQSLSEGPSIWQVQQSASFVDVQGVDAEVEDIDGNGLLDLVVCSYQNENALLEQSSILFDAFSGPDGISQVLEVEGCRSVELLDWDGDGALDIAMAGDAGQNLLLAADDYGATALSSVLSREVIAGDFDGDGLEDVLFVPTDTETTPLQIYWNGNESVDELPILECTHPKVEWLDADVYPELLCPSGSGEISTVFWGSEQGWSEALAQSITTGMQEYITLGYWNHPTVTSILWSPNSNSTAAACEQSIDNTESTACTDQVNTGPQSVAPILLGPATGVFED